MEPNFKVPESGCSSPAIILKRVVLPAPLGPINPTTAPRGTEHIEVAGKTINSRAYVGRFNFKGPDQQKKVGELSGGERNRVHLAKLLRRGGNVLLLDEPTNDLDVTTLRNLENAILDFNGCALVISHDRFFLDRICTHLLVFEGDSKVRWFEGNFEEYQEKRKKELGGKEENRRSKYKKLTIR